MIASSMFSRRGSSAWALRRRRAAAAAAAALLVAAGVAAHAAETVRTDSSVGPLTATQVAGPFEFPWGLAFLPSGALLVTERDGRLLLLEGGTTREVAGVPPVRARGQGGLLDIAVDPEFETNQRVFFTYSDPADGGARTAAARARLVVDGAPALEDVKVIFRQTPALPGGRHFGSRIVLNDDDTVFITTGDRGARDLVQDLSNHIGVVARVTVDGDVPADNPFANGGVGLPETWSLGHRNPQGAARHPETGALWTVEHGAAGGDEINQPEAGKNYGWPSISYGRHYSGRKIGQGTSAPGLEQPVHYWDPSIAPSGLAFYNGDLFPDWRGDLFAGALKYALISRLELEDGKIVGEEQLFEGELGRIRDVRSGPDGALWVLTDANEGWLWRIAPAE